MSKTANSSWETTGKPIVVLTVISLIVSLLLALVVIPEGGLSNRGLVDVTNGRFVDLVVQE